MAGKYKTKQQSAILDCLKLQEKEFLTGKYVKMCFKETSCSVGLTTIYRHLDKMEKDGIVARINVEKQQGACYQYVEEGKNQDCFYIECEVCEIFTALPD